MALSAKKLSHIAISCKDLDKSLAFYRDRLCFRESPSLGSVNGNIKLDIGNGTYLELFPFEMYKSQHQGVLAHFAIEVQSISDTISFLQHQDISILRGPFTVKDKNGIKISTVIFIMGPDGEELELIERYNMTANQL